MIRVKKTYHVDIQERLQSQLHFGIHVDENEDGSGHNNVQQSGNLSIEQLMIAVRLDDTELEAGLGLEVDERDTYGLDLSIDLSLHCHIKGDLDVCDDVDLRLNVGYEGVDVEREELPIMEDTLVSVRSLKVHVSLRIRGNVQDKRSERSSWCRTVHLYCIG